MKKLSRCYCAGLFDGEGYVGVRAGISGKRSERFALRVTIANNHKGVCELLKNQFGGVLNPPHRLQGERPALFCWHWEANNGTAMAFLRYIAHCVIVKRAQVDAALTYPLKKLSEKLTPKEKARRYELANELKRLKRAYREIPTAAEMEQKKRAIRTAELVRQIADLYARGMSAREIAERVGLKPPTVSYWLKDEGIVRPRSDAQRIAGEKRADSAITSDLAKEAARLYLGGLSATETAKRLDRKPATVNYWLRRQGVTRDLQAAQRLRRSRETA